MLALDALQVALECLRTGQRVAGVRREPGPLRVLAQPGEAVLEQEELARGRDVQRGARADHVHDAHGRAARRGTLHIHDLVIVAHGQVYGLAGPLRGASRSELRKASVRAVLRHPRWKMGRKITVDSATLMNKGLEQFLTP